LNITETRISVIQCTDCELSQTCRTPIPFNVPSASRGEHFIVLGEAPGRIEDRKGQAFQGPAGTYLRRALKRAGLDPTNGIYMNVVCCFPHGTPKPEHIAACRRNLYNQLMCFHKDDMRMLVCGNIALHSLLPHGEMKNIMGEWVYVPTFNMHMVPVWHPSFVAFKASRDGQIRWQRDIDAFAGIPTGMTHCVYCTKSRADGYFTCWKHRELWRKDTTWKRSVIQQRLL